MAISLIEIGPIMGLKMTIEKSLKSVYVQQYPDHHVLVQAGHYICQDIWDRIHNSLGVSNMISTSRLPQEPRYFGRVQ